MWYLRRIPNCHGHALLPSGSHGDAARLHGRTGGTGEVEALLDHYVGLPEGSLDIAEAELAVGRYVARRIVPDLRCAGQGALQVAHCRQWIVLDAHDLERIGKRVRILREDNHHRLTHVPNRIACQRMDTVDIEVGRDLENRGGFCELRPIVSTVGSDNTGNVPCCREIDLYDPCMLQRATN